MGKLKKHELIMILVIASAYNAIYSLAFMKGLYYTTVQNGLHLTHFEFGQLYSIYGLFSMFSYLCGAFFLNRYKCWKLIAVSSFTVGILTFSLILTHSYSIMLIIFGIIGFLLGAAFYPAHLQMLHQIGGVTNQGAVFSLFYVCNGVIGIVFAGLGFGITSIPATDTSLVRMLFIFFAVLNVLTSLFATIFLRKLPEDEAHKTPLSLKAIKQLFSNNGLWLVIIIVFTNYIAFATLNYILPFLNDTFNLSPSVTNILSILRVYLISIVAAPIAGKITDRLRSSAKLNGLSFLLSSVTLVFMLLFCRGKIIGTILCLILLCLFVNMGKSMALITIDEARIPTTLYGMSISFISFCAYSPDAFYYSICGFLLDTFPVYGYTFIFIITVIVSIVGYIATLKLRSLKNHS